MSRARRIIANLPEELLDEAMKVTHKSITETLIEGLRLVRLSQGYERAMALREKLHLDVGLQISRERRRR